MARHLTCTICRRPLEHGRTVPWCGQSCRGLHRAIDKCRRKIAEHHRGEDARKLLELYEAAWARQDAAGRR